MDTFRSWGACERSSSSVDTRPEHSRTGIAEELLSRGADVSARNRRGAEPLHYATDGIPGSDAWDPEAQYATVELLIKAGANPNSEDKSGVAPFGHGARPSDKNAAGRSVKDCVKADWIRELLGQA